MTPQEALMYVGRYAPCAHEETTPAGFSQMKCRECGRLWARELPPPLEAREKFIEALNALSAVVNPPPKMDLGKRLLELDRQARYKARYQELWAEHILSKCGRDEAHRRTVEDLKKEGITL